MFTAGAAGDGSLCHDSGVGLMKIIELVGLVALVSIIGIVLALAHPPTARAQTSSEHAVRQTVECVEPILTPAPAPQPPAAEFSQPWHDAYATNAESGQELPQQPAPQRTGTAELPLPISTDYRAAHRFATGAGVRVAVIDTGVFAHEQLNVEPIADLVSPTENDPLHDCDGHGTIVAGIIGADHTGVAPDTQILTIRQSSAHYSTAGPATELDDEPDPDDPSAALTGTLGSFAQAVHTALDHDAQVINASVVSCLPPEQAEIANTQTLDDALARAEAANVPIIAAAGNAGHGCDPGTVVFPGNSETVITVGAVATPHQHAEYSMPQTDGTALAAPGRVQVGLSPSSQAWVAGTIRNGQPSVLQGTSFAAPVVSGTVALLRERYPHANAAEIRDFLDIASYPQHGLIDPARVISHPAPELESASTHDKAQETEQDAPGMAGAETAQTTLVSGQVSQPNAAVSLRSMLVFTIAIVVAAVIFSGCGLRKSRK